MAIADKETAHGLFSFHRGAPKVEDASGTDAQVPAWSGYLNRARHAVPNDYVHIVASGYNPQIRNGLSLKRFACVSVEQGGLYGFSVLGTLGHIDDWCNGSTTGFEPVGGGSKPSLSAR